jgi:hypothetical protein
MIIIFLFCSLRKIKKLKKLISFVGGISEANVSHPLSFALAKDNHDYNSFILLANASQNKKIEKIIY